MAEGIPEARLTVTTPTGPSSIGQAIRDAHPELAETGDVFRHVALQARERLVFMVPFFDVHGAQLFVRLFAESAAKDKILICRSVDDLREMAGGVDVELAKHGVTMLSYRITHLSPGGGFQTETFHAKLALADGVCAYVGSANAMRSSLETTMECGFLVRGAAARQVKDLVDTLLPRLASGVRG